MHISSRLIPFPRNGLEDCSSDQGHACSQSSYTGTQSSGTSSVLLVVDAKVTTPPFCLACQVHASSFYVIPYCFQMLRIFPKKLDEPCDLVNRDRKSTRLNSSHITISYAVFCL